MTDSDTVAMRRFDYYRPLLDGAYGQDGYLWLVDDRCAHQASECAHICQCERTTRGIICLQSAVTCIVGQSIHLFAKAYKIELIGILAFRASPVWVLAALADASGAGRFLIAEISSSLKDEGLLDREANFATVDQMLDGLEASAGRLASTINMPPLDVRSLRSEWQSMRKDLARIPPKSLPPLESLRDLWASVKSEAARQKRSVFEMSSVMALSAVAELPQKARWLSASTRLAVGKTGSVVAGVLLDHYRTTLKQIRERGYLRYAAAQFRPYLYGAVSQFSPKRRSLTERFLS